VFTQNEVIRYENLKVRSSIKMWTHYVKFRRNTIVYDPGTVQYGLSRGYQPTNIPKQTQTVVICIPKSGTVTSSITIGTLVATFYLIGKDYVIHVIIIKVFGRSITPNT